MKIFPLLCAMGFVLAGCSRQAASSADKKYESITLEWQSEMPDVGLTNHCLIVRTMASAGTSLEQKDVSSLDDAANVLGQYGWKLVSSDSKGDDQIYHMERQSRDDGKTFSLILYNAAWNTNKP
jgi:hypothetical protein